MQSLAEKGPPLPSLLPLIVNLELGIYKLINNGFTISIAN